jgi:hypothetical protein
MLKWSGAAFDVFDLRSRNGTFVNEQKVVGTGTLKAGDELRLAPGLRFRLHIHARGDRERDHSPVAWLWHVNTGRTHALFPGAHDLCAVLGQSAVEGGLRLAVAAGRACQIEGGEEPTPIEYQKVMQLGDQRFVILDASVAANPTIAETKDSPWRMLIEVDGRGGPHAELSEPDGASRGSVRAANRVVLLHILAEQLNQDLGAQLGREDAGWVPDERIVVGVWGRAGIDKGASALPVLIHRLRHDLASLGIAGGVVEKRAGWTRLRPGMIEFTITAG